MKQDAFVIGVDYGTDSVRSVLVDTRDGSEISAAVFRYPRWATGLYCDPVSQQFRQHPLDYIEGLEQTVKECLVSAGNSAAKAVRAISVDTTGSTPVAVDESGTPLSLLPAFEKNPQAMFVLWKDHTAIREAAEINEHASRHAPDYLQFVGGIYSSEWFWAKLLHTLRSDEAVRKACYSWVEHCDWIPFLLSGGKSVLDMKRGVCAAGHKALWAEAFGGLPPEEFFFSLDPLLAGFRQRLFSGTHTSSQPCGSLSPEWRERLGLPSGCLVGVGAFDAHMGAVGGQIAPYHLSKVMGTSTCDMLVAPLEEMEGKLIRGICGQVPGSIIPGMMGMEAGQSAFGDSFAWFRDLLSWPQKNLLGKSALVDQELGRKITEEISGKLIHALSEEAARLAPEEQAESATDWLNGRRTPDANQALKAAVKGLHLGTDAPRFFRSIVESTCFGARAIVDRFRKEGIPVKGLIGLGGVARKSPFVMQTLSDVLAMPIRIHRSEQTCAMGAAMFAATVAGLFPRVEEAMHTMGSGFDTEYRPDNSRSSLYDKRYSQYRKLGTFIEENP
jgi:L-ribulokinase